MAAESSEGSSGSSVAAVLAEVEAVFDVAESLPLSCQRPEEVREWARRLQGIRARAEALACRAAVAVGSTDLPELGGRVSAATVIGADARVNPRTVEADVRIGAWLRNYPVFDAALGQGRITRAHIEALRRVENARTTSHLAEAQEYLVEAAESCEWREFLHALRYWQLAFDPDGAEPREQVASRSCRIGKDQDGTVNGRFRLDPIAGQAFLTSLQQEEQRLYRDDTEGDTGAAAGDNPIRSASQRRADALVNLTARGAARPTGTFPAPQVHVVIGHQVVAQLLASLSEDDDASPIERLDLDRDDVDRRCELIDGTPIHPRVALAVAALASFRRQVLRAPSETVDLGRRVRSFPPALKAALLVAARGRCQQWGCDALASRLQADHVKAWNRHGPTALHNGQILCDIHNRAKRDRPPP